MILLKRILSEKRALVLPVALALLANVGVYAFVVYPLRARAAGVQGRAAAAALALRIARNDEAAARALVAGKGRAEEELRTFYGQVIPADQSAARRMTYAPLPELARKTDVIYEEGHSETEDTHGKRGDLGHLKIRMVLHGDYPNLRRFIYELESAPAFVIIDDVVLQQAEANKPLTLTIELSTYFRMGPNGT